MYYLLELIMLPLLFAIWIFFDSKKRNNDPANWTLGAFFLTPIVVPNYYARRNLKKDEVRKGGKNWHRCKIFALYWTILMIYFTLFSRSGKYSLAGSTGGESFGSFELLMIWIIPVGVALLIGIFLKKPSIIEKGPTGSLAENSM